MRITGRVWKLGDDVRATDLLPAAHDRLASRGEWAECAAKALELVRPEFQSGRQPGDLIVAGKNLGAGHAHYHRGGALACRAAGVGALLAESLNGLFMRSAIDEGYVAWAIPGIGGFVADGDHLDIDLAAGVGHNLTQETRIDFKSCDSIILDILAAGSVTNWSIARYERAQAAA